LRRSLALPGFEFHNGVSYRNLLVYRGSEQFDVSSKPPLEIPDERIEKYLPRGRGAELLNQIIDRSREVFAREGATTKATQVWLWGQGHAPNVPRFVDRFNVARGCMITGVDLLRGLANLLGWTVREVPGMTSFHDTNYKGQGEATVAGLDEFDLVFSHVEAPDEASHQADWKTKVAAIEAIDEHIVGPVLERLRTFDDWRILVMPDHPTNIATRKHGYAWPPFCIAGSNVSAEQTKPYNEANAAASSLRIERGHELMQHFLHATL
jgi:2,3-bisphosphoglycerate-independent phosphoglycerate mutase